MSLKRADGSSSSDDNEDFDAELGELAASFLAELDDDEEDGQDDEEDEKDDDDDEEEDNDGGGEEVIGDGNKKLVGGGAGGAANFEDDEEEEEGAEGEEVIGDGGLGELFTISTNNWDNGCIETNSGRSFNVDSSKPNKDGSTSVYLRCSLKTCGASRVLRVEQGQTRENGILQKQKKEHDDACLASVTVQKSKKVRKQIEAQASKGVPYKKARQNITSDLMADGYSIESLAAIVPNKQKGASSYSKKLKGNMPPLPQTTLDIVISPPFARKVFQEGVNEERFLLEVVKLTDKSLVIFASERMLTALGNSDTWLSDGTFSVPLFEQLLTLHCRVGNFIVPCAFCLAPDKQSNTYDAFVNVIMIKLKSMNLLVPKINVSHVMLDFEAGLRNSFNSQCLKYTRTADVDSEVVDPDMNGCHFHHVSALKTHIKSKGLVRECYVQLENRLLVYLRHLFALPFLKPEDIISTYLLLKNDSSINPKDMSTESTEKVKAFSQYYEKTWLGVVKDHKDGQLAYARRISVYGLERRTNNDVESWHAGMAAALKNCRSIWGFIIALQVENIEKEIMYEKIINGELSEKNQSKAQTKKEDKIARLARLYDEKTLTAIDFVKALAPIMGSK